MFVTLGEVVEPTSTSKDGDPSGTTEVFPKAAPSCLAVRNLCSGFKTEAQMYGKTERTIDSVASVLLSRILALTCEHNLGRAKGLAKTAIHDITNTERLD